MVLLAADGLQNKEIADRLEGRQGYHIKHVLVW
jgi:DNA-binding CsgD family transcriptional regulator